MPGKRAENVLEISSYIKGRSLLGLKATYIHREVSDIDGEDQMSVSTVYRWVAKFKSGLQQPRPNVTLKNHRSAQKRFQIYRETISPVHKHVVITSSLHFEGASES